jgi:hypothetical protein
VLSLLHALQEHTIKGTMFAFLAHQTVLRALSSLARAQPARRRFR